MDRWFESDAFWERFRPVLFGRRRWEQVACEIDAILELADPPPGGSVLDLCCGPGRHALELARRGFQVNAVDRTARYLEEGRRRAEEEGLVIEFVQEDMRRHICPEKFDLALNLFTSFGYFEDQADDRRVAQNLYASLKPKGRLVMEMIGREYLARVFRERDWHRLDEPEGALLLEERKLSRGWGWIDCTWILIDGVKRTSHTFSHRPYTGTELASLLDSAGFETVEIYGGFDRAEYDQEANRLVAVAQKGRL